MASLSSNPKYNQKKSEVRCVIFNLVIKSINSNHIPVITFTSWYQPCFISFLFFHFILSVALFLDSFVLNSSCFSLPLCRNLPRKVWMSLSSTFFNTLRDLINNHQVTWIILSLALVKFNQSLVSSNVVSLWPVFSEANNFTKDDFLFENNDLSLASLVGIFLFHGRHRRRRVLHAHVIEELSNDFEQHERRVLGVQVFEVRDIGVEERHLVVSLGEFEKFRLSFIRSDERWIRFFFKEVSEEIRSTHLKCNFANILFSFFLVASSSLTQNLQSKS